jgi:hypothetical protein
MDTEPIEVSAAARHAQVLSLRPLNIEDILLQQVFAGLCQLPPDNPII